MPTIIKVMRDNITIILCCGIGQCYYIISSSRRKVEKASTQLVGKPVLFCRHHNYVHVIINVYLHTINAVNVRNYYFYDYIITEQYYGC